MQLTDYQWSGNPRGMHNANAGIRLNLSRYPPLQLGWMKLVVAVDEFVPDCLWLMQNNITPIIRVYREVPGAMPVDKWFTDIWRSYLQIGVKWFEFYNEPNFGDPEWPAEMRPRVHWSNIPEVIRPLCENFMIYAETIINMGGYPSFPAMGPGATEGTSAILWGDAMLRYLADHFYDRFIQVARNGLWIATHPYVFNHFYQEMPGAPLTPRPPELQNGVEGGWHFEYPGDPLTQRMSPGWNVFSPPFGDPNGLLAPGIAVLQRLKEWFGIDPLPVVGTEGGIYPLPIHGPQQTDPKYPPVTRESHAEATVAMFNWIATHAPPWMFGVTLWKEDEYYNNNLPAVQRMYEVEQLMWGGQRRTTPQPTPPFNLRGPGPVHGEPTFHAVILAPGLTAEWFFDTARAYWNLFRPLVTTRWDFIDYIPNDKSLAVTVIAPPDMVVPITEAIRTPFPQVQFDLLVTGGDLTAITDILNSRVFANRRFG